MGYMTSDVPLDYHNVNNGQSKAASARTLLTLKARNVALFLGRKRKNALVLKCQKSLLRPCSASLLNTVHVKAGVRDQNGFLKCKDKAGSGDCMCLVLY